MPQQPTLDDLKTLVKIAVRNFLNCDKNLLDWNASEWSCAHRIAVYLEPMFPGWNIDCEYNRQGDKGRSKSGNVSDSGLCRPDIAIHHRGEPTLEHNLLAVEIKKENDPIDFIRAKDYIAPPGSDKPYQYQFAVAIELKQEKMTWFPQDEEPPLTESI